MKKIINLFILTVVLFACATFYNKQYAMQCNPSQIFSGIAGVNNKDAYID